MLHPQVLSGREKVLAVLASLLLIALAAFGYGRAVSAQEVNSDSNDVNINTEGAGGTPAVESTPAVEPTPEAPIPANGDVPDSNQIRDQENHQRWQRDEVRRYGRELEDLLRKVPGANVSAFQTNLNLFTTCVDQQDARVGTNEFWDNSNDCNNYRNDLQYEWDDNLWPKKSCIETKEGISGRKRENKDKDRRKQSLLRENPGADLSQINNIDAQILQKIAEVEGLDCNTATRDQVDDANYARQDLDGLFQDWYWGIEPIEETANSARWKKDAGRDLEKNIKRQFSKDMTREMKNLEKNYGKSCTVGEGGSRPEGAEENYNKAKETFALLGGYIKEMESLLVAGNQPDFDDVRNEYWSAQQDYWEYTRNAQEACQKQERNKEIQKQAENRRRELKKMQQEYERAVGKNGGIDSPKAKKALDDYAAILDSAGTVLADDPDIWWQELEPELNNSQQIFWDAINRVNVLRDVKRWFNDLTKEVANRGNDLKNIKRECPLVANDLEGILDGMENVLTKAGELLAQNPEEAQWVLQEFDPLRWEWDEKSQSCWRGKEAKWELDRIRNDLQNAEGQVEEFAEKGKITRAEADVCLDFIGNSVDELDDRIREGDSPEELFDWLESLDKNAYQYCPFRDELDVGRQDFYKDWIQNNVEGLDHEIAAKVLEKVGDKVVSKVIERLIRDPSLINNLMQAGGEARGDVIAQTLSATEEHYSGDSAAQQQILALKAQILEKEKQLEAIKHQLTAATEKLEQLTNEIISYNFYGAAGDKFLQEYEKFAEEVKGMNDAQVQARLEDLRAKKETAVHESKVEKINAGHILFYDEDDNNWHTTYVNALARKGIVEGTGVDETGVNRYNPSGDVTIAQVVTMAYRLIEGSKPQDSFGNSTVSGGKYKNHWSNHFLAWGEKRGLSILADGVDVNRPALRWEVTQVLGEIVNGGKLPTASNTCFSDVGPRDGDVNASVCFAKKNGFMAGVNGAALAWNSVNRAEAATIVKSAGEKGLGINFDANGGGSNQVDEKNIEEEQESEFED